MKQAIFLMMTVCVFACATGNQIRKWYPDVDEKTYKDINAKYTEGKPLFNAYCSKCHQSKSQLMAFTGQQLDNYTIRMTNTQHMVELHPFMLEEVRINKIMQYIKILQRKPYDTIIAQDRF